MTKAPLRTGPGVRQRASGDEKRRPRRGEAQWRTIVQEQQAGGLSVSEFCQRRDLSPVSFYAWRRRFREEVQPGPPAHAFVRVDSLASTNGRGGTGTDDGLHVQFDCGATMRFSAAHLQPLVRLLAELSQGTPRC
jgi:hypothetical protein